MDTNEHQAEQPVSCCDSSSGGADCYSPGSGGAGGGQKSWKTAVFIAVLVLAGAVAAHSLLTKDDQTSGIPPCGGGIGSPCGAWSIEEADPTGQPCPKSAVCPSEQACPKNAPCPFTQSCCPKQDGCPLSDQQNQSSSCCPQTPPTGCCPQAGSL